MRQRLGIAAALLGDPPVLMLDEPFNGLDPEGIVWMRGFLRALAAEGRAVLVSSHLMSELQDAADHLVVVGRGKVVADTSVTELIASASGDRVALRTEARSGAMTVLANAGATVAATGPDTLTVTGLPVPEDRDPARGERGAVQRGVGPPRHSGGGLHGADPGRDRVPRGGGGPVTGPAAPVMAPYQSPEPAGRDGFAQLVHAEWTKLRTVRGWLIGLFLVIVVTDLLGIFGGGSSQVACITGPGAQPRTGAVCTPRLPVGPGGEAVKDTVLPGGPGPGRERHAHRPGDLAGHRARPPQPGPRVRTSSCGRARWPGPSPASSSRPAPGRGPRTRP